MEGTPAPSEIAYYYPEPYWLADEGGWIKPCCCSSTTSRSCC